MEPQDYSKYYYKIITNFHLQKIFGLNVDQASYRLKKLKTKSNKTANDDLWLIELCQHTKVDIGKVIEILNLIGKNGKNEG